MIAVYIIFAVLLFIFVLLCIPFHVCCEVDYKHLQWENDKTDFNYNITLKYLGFRFSFPAPVKREKKKRSEKPKPERQEEKVEKPPSNDDKLEATVRKIKNFLTSHSKEYIIDIIKAFLGILKNFLTKLFKHVTFKRIKSDICLVGSDTEKTTLYYTCAYSLTNFLSNFVGEYPETFKDTDIRVQVGFLSLNSTVELYVDIKFAVLLIIPCVLSFIFKSVKLLQTVRNSQSIGK